jgi:Methylmalonyl-CoA mutase, N-terminal domain/subunit
MAKESHLSRVIDPAGGSYFIEELTQNLCEKAWSIFQEVEKQGGLATALQSGWVQVEIDKVYANRTKNLAKRKQAITGVNQFPDLHEESIETQIVASVHQGLVPRPDAEAFEALRDASDTQLKDKGKRPTTFLANLGTIAQHTARATFAANLLASGGIDHVQGSGGTDHNELCEAFKASQSPVAVICGSDKLYAEHAEALAKNLQAAGAKWIVVAGRPGDNESALREAGVQDFVYLGCNALEALGNLWKQWEAQS